MDPATTNKATLIGRTLAEGRFRITGFIGEGAMATVYRGVQDAEPRDIAIKVMHPHLVGDPSFVKRFRREAKAASVLKHPNSVQIIDWGIEGELPYIAMELLSGQDLFELLVVEKALNQALAVRILIQVSDALAAAHDLGIVHRDLKPENVMLLRDPEDPSMERVKVLDFGIAKIVDRNDKDPDEPPPSIGDSVLTTVGVIVGTPQYMSPEQCRAGPIDARSDVYACGILLYQLVTGKLPFTGEHPFEIAMKQVREPPPLPSSVLPTIHPELEKVILTALEKWPAQRQQSARELRADLAKVLRLLPDDRQVRVSWPSPAKGSAYERRSTYNPDSGPLVSSQPRPPSQPSTMRSAEVPWSERSPDGSKPVSVEMIGVREPVTSTLTSASPVSADLPPMGPPRAAPDPAPLRAPSAGGSTLAEGTAPPVVATIERPAQPGGQLARRQARRQQGIGWLFLIAIGIGIGVGILAFLMLNFMTQ
jgi:serine/threonine-protein kinase